MLIALGVVAADVVDRKLADCAYKIQTVADAVAIFAVGVVAVVVVVCYWVLVVYEVGTMQLLEVVMVEVLAILLYSTD